MHVCVSEWVPKQSVDGGAPVGDVIEEDLQLIVIVKICSNNGANWGWHGKLLGCYVLGKKANMPVHQWKTHILLHTYTEANTCRNIFLWRKKYLKYCFWSWFTADSAAIDTFFDYYYELWFLSQNWFIHSLRDYHHYCYVQTHNLHIKHKRT